MSTACRSSAFTTAMPHIPSAIVTSCAATAWLVTAPAFWLERVNQAGGKVFVDRLLRNVAIALGFHGALAQPGRQRTSADDEFVGSRNIVRPGGRSQFG